MEAVHQDLMRLELWGNCKHNTSLVERPDHVLHDNGILGERQLRVQRITLESGATGTLPVSEETRWELNRNLEDISKLRN